jgi:RNA polymerase sigma factor (sigma-70 family)
MKNNTERQEYYILIQSLPRLTQEETESLYRTEHIPYTNEECLIKDLETESKSLLKSEKEKLKQITEELEKLRTKIADDNVYKYYLTILGRKNNIRSYPSLELRNKIANGYLYLVVNLAKKYYGNSNYLDDFDDLVQIGYEALLSAAFYYIPNGQAKFSTYASKCIENKLKKEVSKKNSKVPHSDFFKEEEKIIEQLEMFLKVYEYKVNNGKIYYSKFINSSKIKHGLDNLILEYNQEKYFRQESSDMLKRLHKISIDEIFNRFYKLVKKSKLNILITEEDLKDIQSIIDYKNIPSKVKNLYVIKYYLETYRYKIEMLERYINAEVNLRKKDENITDEAVLEKINKEISEENKLRTKLKKDGLFENFKFHYSRLYDFYSEYIDIYGVDMFAPKEEKNSRQTEKEKIKSNYNLNEYKASTTNLLEKIKNLNTKEVILYYEIEENSEDTFNKIIVDCMPYHNYQELIGLNLISEEVNLDDYYNKLTNENFNYKEIVDLTAAQKAINEQIKCINDINEYVKKILKIRAKKVNDILKEKNSPIIKENEKIAQKNDLLKMGKKYQRYLKMRDLEQIKFNALLLYQADPELLDTLLENDKNKKRTHLSLEDEVINDLFLEDYEKAKSKLTNDERQVLELYLDNNGYKAHTIKEISQILKMSTYNVKKHKENAIRKLSLDKSIYYYLEDKM